MYRDVRELKVGEPDYPVSASRAWPDATPEVLWVRGQIPVGVKVAVVGARAASGAGLVSSRQLAMGLAGADVSVVSGGALGVDAAAHQGALDAGGTTVVVFGTGIDVVYPPQHGALFDDVLTRGGALVTPFPPGQTPLRWSFPLRNAVIASLARAVVIVEADARSGSLHTADWARKLGRPLIVLLGSAGCDHLAATGAQSATNVDELLSLTLAALAEPPPVPDDAAGPPRPRPRIPSAGRAGEGAHSLPLPLWKAAGSAPPRQQNIGVRPLPDDPRARRLYEALDGTPRDLGEVAAKAGVPAGEALALAIDLELGGLAARAAGGRYLRLS